MNNVSLIGRTTKNIEIRYTLQGKAVARFSIAINEGFGDKQTTSFIVVQVWGKTAENCTQYVHKGDRIAVSGSLRQNRWEKDGKKNSRVYVNAQRVMFLEQKKGGPGEPQNETQDVPGDWDA